MGPGNILRAVWAGNAGVPGPGCGLEDMAEPPGRQHLGPTDSSADRGGEGKKRPVWGSLKQRLGKDL